MISGVNLQHGIDDKLKWKLVKNGMFKLKRDGDIIEGSTALRDCSWEKLVWKKEIPQKIKAFLWLAIQDVIATRSFLLRRKVLGGR